MAAKSRVILGISSTVVVKNRGFLMVSSIGQSVDWVSTATLWTTVYHEVPPKA